MNIEGLQSFLEGLPRKDLGVLERFLEVVVRECSFAKLIATKDRTGCYYDYLHIGIDTIKAEALPIHVVHDFAHCLSRFIDNFFAQSDLRGSDYDDFQVFKQYMEQGISCAGEDIGRTPAEISDEADVYFRGIFIRDANKDFALMVSRIIEMIHGMTKNNTISTPTTTATKHDADGKRTFVFDEKNGLYDPADNTQHSYRIKKERGGKPTGSYKLLNNLCSNETIGRKKLTALLNTRSNQDINKRIEDINNRFCRIFDEEDKLIVNCKTGGISINDKFRITKLKRS